MQPSWLVTVAAQKNYRNLVVVADTLIVFSAVTIVTSVGIGLVEGMMSGLFLTLIVILVETKGKGVCVIDPVEVFKIPSLDEVRVMELSNSTMQPFLGDPVTGAKIGAKIGAILSLINVLLMALTGSLTIKTVVTSMVASLLFGTISGLSIGILRGFSMGFGNFIDSLKVRLETREEPNQGILTSAKNFLSTSLYFLTLYAICLFVSFLTGVNLLESSKILILIGLYFAFYKGGGLPIVQHFVLRFLLYCQGNIPWNYAKFLEYTTERRLTQQIGGRFRFIHRELLDHFAAMEADA